MNIKTLVSCGVFLCAASVMALPEVLMWDKLNVDEFKEARDLAKGTVLIPFGCTEKHARHLPLGTDSIVALEYCRKASKIEPVLVFDMAPLGLVCEAKHRIGTISVSSATMTALLEELCDEFARNGCTNVIIVSEHGGNTGFLSAFVRSRLEKPRAYNLYYWEDKYSRDQYAEWHKRFGKPPLYGHAGMYETSLMLALAPGLVQMDKINEVECEPKFRSNYLRKARLLTPTDWYAECDTQSYGNPKTASVELGNFLVDASVSNLVNAIRIVKEDTLTNTLRAEYDALCKNPQP